MKTLNLKPLALIFAAGALALFSASASASTILISDPLTSVTSKNLDGTSPAVDVGGGTWSVGDDNNPYGHSTFTETVAGTSESGGAQADLSVDPITAGNIYTLSVTVTDSNPVQGDLVYLGFFDEIPGTYLDNPPGNAVYGRNFYNGAGATIEMGDYGNATLDTNAGQYRGPQSEVDGLGGPNVLTLVLNTQASAWTLEGFLNGVPINVDPNNPNDPTPDIFTYSTNPTGLNSVYIATSGVASAEFKDFSLVAAGSAPEPATWASLFLGLGVLGFYLRRRSQS